MSDEKVFLTPAQAESVLLEGDQIHTFRSGAMTLIGCDWSRKSILEVLRDNPDKIEIGGSMCRRMNHGLCVWTSKSDPLFIECDDKKLQELENKLTGVEL